MRTHHGPRVESTILGAATLFALAMGGGGDAPERLEAVPPPAAVTGVDPALAGTWVSADQAVRLRLEPDGSYGSQVAGRKRAATGTYRVTGTVLLLRDDTGLRTEVTVAGEVLELAGHRLFRV